MRNFIRNQRQTRPGVVWVWFIFTVGVSTAAFLLFIRNVGTPVPASWGVEDGIRSGTAVWINVLQQHLVTPILVSFLGALIVARRPGHPIGRLLMAIGMVSALLALTQEWAVFGYFTLETPAPGTTLAAWITNWLWVILFTLLLLTTALFPEGRFLSRRWAWIVGVPLFVFALTFWIGGTVETPMSSAFQIPNPFVAVHPVALYEFVFGIGAIAMPATTLAVLLAVIVRFRRSQAQERQQMKWLMFGVVVMAFLTVAGLAIYFGLNNTFGSIMVNSAIVGPILGIAMALLRYRLYDIDILIRRTLVYTLSTGLLALVYFGSIVLLQTIFDSVSDERSPVIIVASTLLIAALFSPLRRRVQETIDRRFFRQKYDAAQVLAAFALTARDETDLNKLMQELQRVVEETMQPEGVGTWLKPTAR